MLNNFLNIDTETKSLINSKVIDNYSKLKLSLFFLPILLLTLIVLVIYLKGSLSVAGYIQIQKECFYYINSKLSQFPNVMYNLTQVGDTLVFLSLLAILIVYAPKFWESLIMAILISVIFSVVLKNLFAVPRPAASFDNNSFTIIGQTLSGHNSLPSGHSITVFTILTVLLFGFMPRNINQKMLWIAFIVTTGLVLAFTRVGVGAHYPLDVIVGCSIGYICGLLGIIVNRKFKAFIWINDTKYYPLFILLILIGCFVLADRIVTENLLILYLSLISLVISIFKIALQYAKR